MKIKRSICMVTACILFLAGFAHAADQRIAADLAAQLDGAGTYQKLPVIVVLNESSSGSRSFSIMMSQFEVLTALADSTPTYLYVNIPAIAVDLDRYQIFNLTLLNSVKRIEYDKPMYAFMDTAAQYSGTRLAQSEFGLSGAGVTVAVIDSGIDGNHSAFLNAQGDSRIIAFKDFVNKNSDAYDDNGHGSHCAGIAVGGGLNGANQGVAPAANLVGVKVLNSAGSGSSSTVIAGIDWCISNRDAYSIDIISMSLGGTGSSDGTDIVSQAVNSAVSAGIVTVVAAGNSGPAIRTIASPAAAEAAITVGAMADPGEGGFDLAYFSSRGPTADGRIKPDICAPGVNITAPQANSGNGYVTMSGTSMATPFVAGTVALMLEANPGLSPQAIKDFLHTQGEDWGMAGVDSDYGWGRLDGYHAIAAAEGVQGGSGPAVPLHNTVTGTLSAPRWLFPKSHIIALDVSDLSNPVSLSLIMDNWSVVLIFFTKVNFNLFLRDPAGGLLASATGNERQETISAIPTVTGRYTVEIKALWGASTYYLDASGGTLNP